MPSTPESKGCQTATEIAAFLNVTPRTVYQWAEEGRIPTAFRNGRTVRFSLDTVMASLNVNYAGQDRNFELVVLALSLVFGPAFPRIPQVDLDSITMHELGRIKRLCAIYADDLANFESAEECGAYAEAVLEAARIVGTGI
jgi:excisionase family DNA binding protein